MPAPFIIPFNNCPASVINLTNAGYTVPAGKYANIDYTLYSGVMSVDNNMIATGTGTYEGSTVYASGTTSATGTTELTLVTASASVQGYLYMQWTVASNTNGSSTTVRHRRGGSVIGSTSWTHDGTTTRSATWWGFVLAGDTLTAQQTVSLTNSRTVSLFGDVNASGSYVKEGSFWLNEGAVITFASPFPVSVAGIVQLYNKIS